MSATKVNARINSTSLHPSLAQGQTSASAPTAKSSWSNGTQDLPGAIPRARFTKLFNASPPSAPIPSASPSADSERQPERRPVGVVDQASLPVDRRLQERGAQRNDDSQEKSRHGLVRSEPALADRPVPSLPVLDEGSSHVAQVGGRHEVDEREEEAHGLRAHAGRAARCVSTTTR